jgi:hypothetical protein
VVRLVHHLLVSVVMIATIVSVLALRKLRGQASTAIVGLVKTANLSPTAPNKTARQLLRGVPRRSGSR